MNPDAIETTTACQDCANPIPESIRGDALCVECRYGTPPRTPARAGQNEFDVAVETVAAPGHTEDNPEEIEAAQQLAALKMAAATGILEIICAGATPKEAGQRAFILKYSLQLGSRLTQRDLAEKLGVSLGTVNGILNKISADFTRINIDRNALRVSGKLNTDTPCIDEQ